jgi:hypothetical protein
MDRFYARMGFQFAVVTQRPDGKRVEFGICQQAIDEDLSYFTRCTCD